MSRAVSDALVVIIFITIVIASYVIAQPFLSRIIVQTKQKQAAYQAKIIYAFYPTGQTNLHIGILNDGDTTITVLYLVGGTPANKISINQQIPPHTIADIQINGIILPPAYIFFDDGSYLKVPLPTPPTYTTINI
jgi:hypothetical protein